MKKGFEKTHILFNFPTRILVLEYLYKNNNKKKSEIAKDLGLIWGNAYKTYVSLRDLGLVEEKDRFLKDYNGRRRKIRVVALTEKGRLVAEEIIKIGRILR